MRGTATARTEALAGVLTGSAWIGLLYGAGLDRQRVLATRDVLVFHLPLRSDLATLVGEGSAGWNPWIHGGQPVLSNPNYAAFYPPTWLGWVVEPHYALGLGLVLHAALAFAGAWWLVRRLGGGPAASALAALGWSGCGAFLSLTHAYTAFTAAAWWPWMLGAADAALREGEAPAGGGDPGPARRRRFAAGATAVTLALQLLAGEPMIAAAGGIAVAVIAVASSLGALRPATPLVRCGVILLLAAGLSAVQWVPTAHHLAASPRGDGLAAEEALTWSLHPARLAEVAYPRLYGDPARYAAGYYFGSPFHDRAYAYLPALHPGLVLLVPGLVGLLGGWVARRRVWRGLAAAGLVLALGRFLPVYPLLQAHLPPFSLFRYPEKFAILLTFALVVAGALGWARILDPSGGSGRGVVWTAGLVTLGAAVPLGLAWLAPAQVTGWISRGAPRRLSEAGLERALVYLRWESLMSLGLALGCLGLLLLARRGRVAPGVLAIGALLLLAADLHHHGAGLLRWLPTAEALEPPAVAASVRPGTRLFIDDALYDGPEVAALPGDPALQPVRSQLARLDPYSGNLFGIPYALTSDFDRMRSSWHGRAAGALATDWPRGDRVLPLLGAWNVGTLILRGALAEPGREPVPADGRLRVVVNPFVLPRIRAVGEVRFHADPAAALAAVAAAGYRVDRVDHWLAPPPFPVAPSGGGAEVLAAHQRGGDLRLRVRRRGPSALVVADTFDRGWRAELGGRDVPIYPTALGQMGLILPAGEGPLELRYRDPTVPVGATITGLTLLGLLVAWGVPLRRRRGAGSAGGPGQARPLRRTSNGLRRGSPRRIVPP